MIFFDWLRKEQHRFFRLLTPRRTALLLTGAAIMSFGLYHIHRQTGITEGGVLGMVLLLNHHFGTPGWLVIPMLDTACYAVGWRQLGGDFLRLSIVSTAMVSVWMRIWQLFPPLLAGLIAFPFLAAVLAGLCIGIGVGLIVGQGGSSGGDDALALVISKLFHCRLSRAYLATDLTVLLLSLTYIPINRIIYSLVAVTLSSLIIEVLQRCFNPGKKNVKKADSTACPHGVDGRRRSGSL